MAVHGISLMPLPQSLDQIITTVEQRCIMMPFALWLLNCNPILIIITCCLTILDYPIREHLTSRLVHPPLQTMDTPCDVQRII